MTRPNRDPNDFTIQISLKEKILTSLLFAFFMGGILLFARRQAMIHTLPSPIFNLFFAVGLFGVIRMVRCVFAQNHRGVRVEDTVLKVETLFSKIDIPFADLVNHTVTFKQSSSADQPQEISFLWGQFRYRLPCSNGQILKELLASKGVQVLFVKDGDHELKQILEKAEHIKANPRRSQRPPTGILFALILWSIGTVGMFFLH